MVAGKPHEKSDEITITDREMLKHTRTVEQWAASIVMVCQLLEQKVRLEQVTDRLQREVADARAQLARLQEQIAHVKEERRYAG